MANERANSRRLMRRPETSGPQARIGIMIPPSPSLLSGHRSSRCGRRRAAESRPEGRQVFGAVARTDTDLEALIRRSLDAVGRTKETVLTAFTDSCPRLRRILLDAGIPGLPILDWFHLAMRLRHLTQIAGRSVVR
jgi:hypothetical protein